MAKGGLGKWFAEDWTDIKTGKKCGRSGSKDKKRAYPACRPKKVAKKMTTAEKRATLHARHGMLHHQVRDDERLCLVLALVHGFQFWF
jgi:hypothetical protein